MSAQNSPNDQPDPTPASDGGRWFAIFEYSAILYAVVLLIGATVRIVG